MSSTPRSAREEERRLNIRTLVIASVASAIAAVVTSQFWIAGTPIAAAVTPVIVALVSELLHRPTERIAERFTAETDALPADAMGAGPPPRDPQRAPAPARDLPPPPEERGVSMYRSAPRRRLPVRTIAVTAVLAFVIGAAVLTLPELLTGQSIGKGDGKTSIFATDRDKPESEAPQEQAPMQTTPEEEPQTVPEETTPEEQPTETAPAPPTTAPQTTTPAP